jgi:HEAT repeat protein
MLTDEWARYPAIEALGLLKVREAITPLLELYDGDEWVRNAVIEALGNIGAADTVDFLIDRLDMDNEMLLHATLVSLAKIEQNDPSGAFAKLQNKGVDVMDISRSALTAHNPDTKRSALWILGMIGGKGDLPALIEQISCFDEEMQVVARQAIVRLGSRHIHALVNFNHSDEMVQESLIGILGEIRNREAIPSLLTALEQGSNRVRAVAARTLPIFKESSVVEPLIKSLTDSISHVRSASAYALGELRSVKATRSLILLLEDEYQDVRESASEALGKIGTLEIITHVAPLLKHTRMEVRQAAIQCMGLITDRRADSYLVEALNNSDRGVRRFAANALGTRKVINSLKSLMMSLMDEDWQVRKSSATALGYMRDQRAVETLVDSLRDENIWVRYAAVIALGKIGGDRARIKLHGNLRRDATPIRIATIEALLEMKDPELVSLLIPLSDDPDDEVRCSVAETLGRLNIDAARETLNKLTEDRCILVQQTASRAMERMKSPN